MIITENNAILISTSIVDTAFAYVPMEYVCRYMYIHCILVDRFIHKKDKRQDQDDTVYCMMHQVLDDSDQMRR